MRPTLLFGLCSSTLLSACDPGGSPVTLRSAAVAPWVDDAMPIEIGDTEAATEGSGDGGDASSSTSGPIVGTTGLGEGGVDTGLGEGGVDTGLAESGAASGFGEGGPWPDTDGGSSDAVSDVDGGASWTSGGATDGESTGTTGDTDGGGCLDGCDGPEPGPPIDGEPPCETDCGPSVCGDGWTAPDEECDDGNDVDGDGCSIDCRLDAAGWCGDGWVSGAEACDDWNEVDGDGCSSACTLEDATTCGDGALDPDEDCDDGNLDDGDGCSNMCRDEPGCGGDSPPPAADPEPSTRRFCGVDTAGLDLDGFEVGAQGCQGEVEDHEAGPSVCGELPPKNMANDGGTFHEFTDGKVEEWKLTAKLKLSFDKVPVLGELAPEYEASFTNKHIVDTRLEVRFDSGELPTVFVTREGAEKGAWMNAGSLVSARRVAESKDSDTVDGKFTVKLWVAEGSTAQSDERFKSVRTSIKYRKGEGAYGASVKAKELLGKPDLADDAPVSTAEVTEALRKQMNGAAVRTKLEQEHSAALAAAGYVWGQKKIDYGCGLGPDGKGGVTKVCIVPWCKYDALYGSKNFLGVYGESVTYTSSGLFMRKVEKDKSYVLGDGSAVDPHAYVIRIHNCSPYEIKDDSMKGLWTGAPVWERGGWGVRGENKTLDAPLMATGATDCRVGKKREWARCFFTTRTLDPGNYTAVFGWQANQLFDADRVKFR